MKMMTDGDELVAVMSLCFTLHLLFSSLRLFVTNTTELHEL
jgi:hypothetical protein